MSKLIALVFCFILASNLQAVNSKYNIVVSKDGYGDFTTISDAIGSLPMYNYERVIILVKNGVYEEKFKIECDYVTLIGESRENTIIRKSIVREEWINLPDPIGPAVVNIYADDIILRNLTIENSQPKIGPHAFAVYGTGTRTILDNCICLSKGGDTVSLWNYKEGMYYHSNCHFEGAVDFVCPRGWCYIRNSSFYEHKQTAAIWHAGVVNPDQKFVLDGCSFDGVDGFYLARHHYEAQFYLLNSTFSESMKDKPIEHVVYKDKPEKNRPYFYGNRYFFFNCSRDAGSYDWFSDNLDQWPKGITPDIINAEWTFDDQWNPEDNSSLSIEAYKIEGNSLLIYFPELVSVRGRLILKTHQGTKLKFEEGIGRNILRFSSKEILTQENVAELEILEGEIYAIRARLLEKQMLPEFSLTE